MRRSIALAAIAVTPLLLGWGWHRDHDRLDWPQSGRMPDEPVPVQPYRYAPVTSGNKSYRPIAPLPWGGVNNRVAPPGTLPGSPPAKKQQGGEAPAVARMAAVLEAR